MNSRFKYANEMRSAFIETIPVFAGYLVLGIGFGIMLTKNGYSIAWAFVMAVTIYAGAMQYLAVDLLTGGASLITTAITTLLVNARHLFYGLSLLKKYKGAGLKKIYMIFALTDETYSLVSSKKPNKELDSSQYYFFISIFNQCYWIVGCCFGAFLGATIPFNSQGIDFALTALFVTIFVEQWKSTKNHIPAIIGVLTTLTSLVVFGQEHFLIPSMIGIAILLTLLRNKRLGEENE